MLQFNEAGFNLADVEMFKNYKEKHFQGHKKCPSAMAWNPSGSLLVTAENSIKTWHFLEDYGLEKAVEVKGHDTSIDWAEFGTSHLLGTLSREAIRFWDVRENGKMNSIKLEKKGKYDFIKFAWNNAESNGEGLKLAVINKDNTVLVYDYKHMAQPLFTIPPKANSSL
jgi:WD40 repeat protein